MGIKEIITIIVAIYGAILSTVNIILHIKTQKTSLLVKLSEGYLVGREYRDDNLYLFWNAYNKGAKKIKLSMVGFRIKGIKKYFQIPYQMKPGIQLPFEIKPGNSYCCWTTTKQVAESLKKVGCSSEVKIIGYFTDAIKNRYYSQPYRFNIEENLKNETK